MLLLNLPFSQTKGFRVLVKVINAGSSTANHDLELSDPHEMYMRFKSARYVIRPTPGQPPARSLLPPCQLAFPLQTVRCQEHIGPRNPAVIFIVGIPAYVCCPDPWLLRFASLFL